MTTCEHVLHGCAPVPLAGYLKALGVFRLVAEQTDPDVLGYWRDERFVLRTRLTEDEFVGFFLNDYRPTPVVAPWNGGSGFWEKDNHEGIESIKASDFERLASYRTAIDTCERLISEHCLSEAPKDDAKASLLAALRGALSEEACRWLDGALALTMDGPRYPPILGTGGNDGRLDFSNNFMQRLTMITNGDVGKCMEILRSSLFSMPSAHLEEGAVGQFSPGAAGGVNAGVGFKADSWVNPWDFILTVEGAMVFAAAAARRHAQDRKAALTFPFTTRSVGAGSGATTFADETDARAEFWAPLWSRAAGFDETSLMMSEGRAVLDGGAARDGLDFARAVAQLGIARGIDTFQRHGFLMRAGKAYFATPLGRVRVRENQRASLISELDIGGWLSRVRKTIRDFGALGRGLDEALFRLTGDGSTKAVQETLIAVGELVLEAGRRPKLRKDDKGMPPLPPPPRLSTKWADAADDGSHEFALAEALASLDAIDEGEARFSMPFRCHLAPLTSKHLRDGWDDTTAAKALAVWNGRDLIRDMAAVLERRLIEGHRHVFTNKGKAELPLRGCRAAPLAAIAAFLAGRTDEARIAALAAGLAWTRSRTGVSSGIGREDAVPFAYAALKPLFIPDGVGSGNGEKRLLDPLPLVRLIRAGRVANAVTLAQRMARGAGLPTPFARLDPSSPVQGERLVAALLFPSMAHDRLIGRAYPDLAKNEEEPHAA
ncbi:MAG: type I-U CRISPR-associated protein Csx17 [Alphaproteobacteria bacterium]|nr:type I-U CRISPR-associated protein Csx17 [Alphaproteobacteria bacterium]